jgi:hypothetical protein
MSVATIEIIQAEESVRLLVKGDVEVVARRCGVPLDDVWILTPSKIGAAFGSSQKGRSERRNRSFCSSG